MTGITTRIDYWHRLYANDVTSNSYTNAVPTTTDPTGLQTGFFRMTNNVGSPDHVLSGGNILKLVFFGTGADNATMTARVSGFSRMNERGSLWISNVFIVITATLSGATGVANSDIDDHYRFADTVTATAYVSSASYELVSPADDTPAMVKLDMAGSEFAYVQLKTGTATGCNGLAASF